MVQKVTGEKELVTNVDQNVTVAVCFAAQDSAKIQHFPLEWMAR